jgi:co-chaperonin GroES (HSP10)
MSESEKIGSGILFAPGNVTAAYKLGYVVVAPLDNSTLSCGDKIIYDSLGTIEKRIEDRLYTFVKVLNIISIIRTETP